MTIKLPGRPAWTVIGWTLSASAYCIDCAGYDGEHLPNPDKEGNSPHPVFAIDEGVDDLFCDRCLIPGRKW